MRTGINRQLGNRSGLLGSSLSMRELNQFLHRLTILVLLISALVVIGTAGFTVFEKQSVWISFIHTLDTIATIGSLEPASSTSGQILTVVLITLGVGTMFYALVAVTEFFVAGHLSGMIETRKMERKISQLNNHYIVCGFGRVGRQVSSDLVDAGVGLVVVDSTVELIPMMQELGLLFISGNTSDEKVLRQAGIDRAKALIAAVDNDADNVFITLTAREINPDIEIVARASEEKVFSKLQRAGANRVVSPYMVSGEAMAKLALQPQVREYLDVVTGSAEFRMEEIELAGPCKAEGCSVGDLSESSDAIIVALKKIGRELEIKPSHQTLLEKGDIVVALGDTEGLEKLEQAFFTYA